MRFHSIRFKLSIFYTLVLAVLFIAYAVYLYSSLRIDLVKDFDSELSAKSEHIQKFLKKFYTDYAADAATRDEAFLEAIAMTIHLEQFAGDDAGDSDMSVQWLQYFDLLDLSEDHIHFYNPHDKSSTATNKSTSAIVASLVEEIKARGLQGTHFFDLKLNNTIFRVVQQPVTLHNSLVYVLQIATSQKKSLALLEERKNTLLVSIPILLLLAIFIGRFFSDQLTRPLINVAKTAEHISHRDLSQRISTKYRDEEIITLVEAFNNMLNRLENSFKHITDFNSHVSHELKTPIAIISGECEVALRKNQSTSEYKETLVAVFEEAQKMLKITEDLLLLTRLDYSLSIFKREEFRIWDFFPRLERSISRAGYHNKHKLSLKLPENDAVIKGDPVHLRRLFLNVISNAIKFTPDGGNIAISVSIDEKDLIVKISDSGVGIKENELGKIFNQFYHNTPVSSGQVQGNGLGLSIAQTIAKVHFGEIKVESSVGQGSTFTVILPVVISTAALQIQSPVASRKN